MLGMREEHADKRQQDDKERHRERVLWNLTQHAE